MNQMTKNADFDVVIAIIESARENAFKAVNRELIDMYWHIGEYVSQRVADSNWGKSVVKDFSDFIQNRYVGIKGFSPSNIWRMRQFYETYQGNEKLAPLVREINWTNNILIMLRKTDEEREFYLNLSVKNKYTKRELERQINSLLFERTMLSDVTNKLIVQHNEGLSALRDSYVLEFLDLPDSHKEKDLQKAITSNLKNFILEFGKDFAFVGEEYRLQVGNRDFFIDLLFYNRSLRCLVAIELKIGEFEPAHLGQLNFYLEALDRDVKKVDENPSVGLILCSEKDSTVVEYALSRSMSPALIADYKLHLPDKQILENKLRELTDLATQDDQGMNE
ncbi:MAG: PDDEXK nuclease domain-containing protein [Deferribacteraceae bacterium]|jgi:predicted nuclease of restriction endonuclease-like (RecB) superfamily|nr:PDDEXK nuclease domain-containing protein [Deferribacteraceae bacterium]